MNTTTVASKSGADLEAVYQALDRVQAIIEFDLDGTVLSANDNFLKLFGYERDKDGKPESREICDGRQRRQAQGSLEGPAVKVMSGRVSKLGPSTVSFSQGKRSRQ